MSLTTPTAADFDERADTAVRLLCEGHSETYIAAQLGCSSSAVRRLLRAAARAKAEDREEAIERHRSQLRYLWHRVLQQHSGRDAKTGEEYRLPLKADTVRVLLSIQEREARLLGLDAPTRQEHLHDFAGASTDELIREAQRLGVDVTQLQSLPAPTQPPDDVIDAEYEVESPAAAAGPSPTPQSASSFS